jgi:hypothetical protein
MQSLHSRQALHGKVVFERVSKVIVRGEVRVLGSNDGVACVEGGELKGFGREECANGLFDDAERVDLDGGAISPGLVAYGAPLGLTEIEAEPSTNDGHAPAELPELLGGESAILSASDGLQFGGRDALFAYRSGVTSAISAPSKKGLIGGLGVAFSTGAGHRLERGAYSRSYAGLHVLISHGKGDSVGTQVATLRRLLRGSGEGELGARFKDVVNGKIPLVVQVNSADVMATLLEMKEEIEKENGNSFGLTFTGAQEAHLLAREIGNARVGVILTSVRPFPHTWDSQRILPGPPLSKENAISVLRSHGVRIGVGVLDASTSRNLRFDIGWAALETGGSVSEVDAWSWLRRILRDC